MNRTTIAQLYADQAAFGGQTVTVAGWARTIRAMKNLGFLTLNDGSCFKNLQVVLEERPWPITMRSSSQNVGAAFIVTGKLVLTPDAKQPFELQARNRGRWKAPPPPTIPCRRSATRVEFLRTIQHLRPRTNLFSAAFRVRSVAAHAIHCFFQDRGFVYVHTPIITASDCEGAGEMFQVTTLDIE